MTEFSSTHAPRPSHEHHARLPGRSPNVIMIVVDDLGWRDLSCYGSTFYQSPCIDGLARSGARFTDGYAASPVCSPTRASIMTGKYPARIGLTQVVGGHAVGALSDVPSFTGLPSNEISLARQFRAAGYHTWHVGKWHLGGERVWPDRHGFDVNIAGCGWGMPHTYFSPYGCPTLTDGPDGEYLTDRLTDEAISLIRTAGDQPFFLNLWHYAVHVPIQAPEELVQRYRQRAHHLGLDAREAITAGETFPIWRKRDQNVRRRVIQSDPVYAAMIENLDSNTGRLLAALDEANLTQDTIVVLTSDNGGLATAEGSPTSNLPLAEGKGWPEEGGIRVPLIVRWPGVVTEGRVITEPVTSPDLYPTLLSAAGAQPNGPDPLDGVDLTPLLRGRPFDRGPIYWHYPHYSNQGGTPSCAVRDGGWKLVRRFGEPPDELYDLHNDLSETADVAASNPDRVAVLGAQLDTWLHEVDGRVPQRNPSEPFADSVGRDELWEPI